MVRSTAATAATSEIPRAPRHADARRPPGCTLIVLLLTATVMLAGLPGVGASGVLQSDQHEVRGDLHVPADPRDAAGAFLLLSGALELGGTFGGPVFGMDTHDGTRIAAPLLRVYDTRDHGAIARQEPALELEGATLVPATEGSFYWSVPEATVDAEPAYTFSFLFNIEANLPAMGAIVPERDGPPPPSLVAQGIDAPWTFSAPGTERSVYLPLHGGFRVVAANGTTQTFDDRWMVTLRGATEAQIGATGIAVPFERDMQATFAPASDARFAAAFSVERLERFLGLAGALAQGFEPPGAIPEEGSDRGCIEDPEACARAYKEATEGPDGLAAMRDPRNETDGDNETGGNGSGPEASRPEGTSGDTQFIAPEAVQALESVAGLLNGAFIGRSTGVLTVGGEEQEAGFSIVRYTRLTLSPTSTEQVAFAGEGPFVFSSGNVHHDESVVQAGPLIIPLLSLFLYLLAVGAYVGARIQTFRPLDEERTRRLWAPALVTQWSLIAVAFILFDHEVHFVLGQSLLGSFGLYGGTAAFAATATMSFAGPGLIAAVQLGMWAAASVAFGVPIAIIGRSALKAAGFGRPTYGFAIGVAALFTWILGTSLILPILDVAFTSLAGAA